MSDDGGLTAAMGGTQQVVAPPATAAVVLVVTVEPGHEKDVRALLAEIAELRRGVGFRATGGSLALVVGIGSDLWDRMYSGSRPALLHTFTEVAGRRHTAVSTAGDLLFHIRASRMDLCFELASRISTGIAGHGEIVDETHGFRYFDNRDLLGFVDGTENPDGDDARTAALVGDEDPAFAGGSYVLVQKYLHDLAAWNALGVAGQEGVIGRTKLEDIELDDAAMPPDSHVALNTVDDGALGDADIVRANMPFGSIGAGEFGTYFIGYAANPAAIEQKIRNMFLGVPPGRHDRILDFSTAVTGTLFFAPPASVLRDGPGGDPAGAPDGSAVDDPAAGTAAPDDEGSLRIGGLKGNDI